MSYRNDNAPVINIEPAKRSGARLVVGLAGISGSGKTMTALQLAYGLAKGDGRKVGLLCTENRRGRLYADRETYEMVQKSLGLDRMPAPFMVGDLEPPFSPQRYIAAIRQFQEAGVEALVVDSVSHEWEGTGGCEEIAHATGRNGNANWAVAKREHKQFMNVLLQSDMHIIACIRAREKVKMGRDDKGKTTVEPIGIQPVTEKNFMFELTASLLMWDAGRAQQELKMPDALRAILGRATGYITAADGLALRHWVDGGEPLDPEIERARNTLRTVCADGLEAYRAAFEGQSRRVKQALVKDGTHEVLKESAQAYDRQRAEAKAGGAELLDLNEQVAGK